MSCGWLANAAVSEVLAAAPGGSTSFNLLPVLKRRQGTNFPLYLAERCSARSAVCGHLLEEASVPLGTPLDAFYMAKGEQGKLKLRPILNIYSNPGLKRMGQDYHRGVVGGYKERPEKRI